MKASELISKLQEFVDRGDDLEVMIHYCDTRIEHLSVPVKEVKESNFKHEGFLHKTEFRHITL